MKIELENLRLGISGIDEKCCVGIMDNKNPMLWKHKKEIDNDFIHAVITRWENKIEVFTKDGWEYRVSVRKVKQKTNEISIDEHKNLQKSLYPKDNSKKFTP
jgi:hypothetical protein